MSGSAPTASRRAGAYVFLGAGRTAFLSGRSWPAPRNGRPGVWVEDDPDGIRVCEPGDLPWWLDEELWEAEPGGAERRVRHALVAERARLLRRVHAWGPPVAWELVEAVVGRVRDRAVAALAADGHAEASVTLARTKGLDELRAACAATSAGAHDGARLAGFAADAIGFALDAPGARGAGVAAYVAAHALAGGDAAGPGYETRFAEERAWQAEWLRARLSL
ncbi:MAG TPA: hypothetical protein VFR43_08680 [Gaiellaceae bacterium]|nr:hypothetical protein [Gaiellaceae bacterium]